MTLKKLKSPEEEQVPLLPRTKLALVRGFTCPVMPRSELCSTTGVVKFIREFLLLGYSKMVGLKKPFFYGRMNKRKFIRKFTR